MTFTELYTTIDNQLEDNQRIMDMTDLDYELIVADLTDAAVMNGFMRLS
jgi:hypothetical protein